jgi:hypothetical protein
LYPLICLVVTGVSDHDRRLLLLVRRDCGSIDENEGGLFPLESSKAPNMDRLWLELHCSSAGFEDRVVAT